MTITNANIGSALRRIERALIDDQPPVVTLIAQQAKDPFRVLVSTVLSLRTKDAVTAAASARLFAVADTPRALRALPEARIRNLIYPVCFYRVKARSLREISRILIERHGSRVPDSIDVLLTLPGVGRKTANLVLIEGYGKPAMCVDTHVHRISNRWGYVRTETPDKTEIALREKLPLKHWLAYNMLLVGFGQKICQPVSPKCSACPLNRICPRIGVTRSR